MIEMAYMSDGDWFEEEGVLDSDRGVYSSFPGPTHAFDEKEISGG